MAFFECVTNNGTPIEKGTISEFTNGSVLPSGKYYFLVCATVRVNSGGYNNPTITASGATLIIQEHLNCSGTSGYSGGRASLYYAESDGVTPITFTLGSLAITPQFVKPIHVIAV